MAPAATYTDQDPVFQTAVFTKELKLKLGTFGVIGDKRINHAHPSGIKGLHSPAGSDGWRADLGILVDGKRTKATTPIMADDFQAAAVVEMLKLWRKIHCANYGDNSITVQAAYDEGINTLPPIEELATFYKLKAWVQDNLVDRTRGAAPALGVHIQPNLYRGAGGYVAFFSGSMDGVRQRIHLGCWPKTEEGLKAAAAAWDKAALKAGYRKARLNNLE